MTVPCSPDSSSGAPVQNLAPPNPAHLKNPSPVQQSPLYVSHNGDPYPSHIHQSPYYNLYPSPNGMTHSTITSASTTTYSPPITTNFGTPHHANGANLMIPASHIISSNLSHHLLTPLTPLSHTNGRPSPPVSGSPDNNVYTSFGPASPNGQNSRGDC